MATVILDTEAQQFSIRLFDQLKANGHPTLATYIARQIQVIPPFASFWLLVTNAAQTEMIGNLNIPAVLDCSVKISVQKTVFKKQLCMMKTYFKIYSLTYL